MNQATADIGVIHLGEKQPSSLYLAEKLKEAGYGIRQWHLHKDSTLDEIDDQIRTFIVNLYFPEFNIEPIIDGLVGNPDIQVIFNDAAFTNKLKGWEINRWIRHILFKINRISSLLPEDTRSDANQGPLDLQPMGIHQVWILAASIGGPDALVRFLSSFQGDEPVLFIVAQHMDKEFMLMMEKQLQKNGKIDLNLPKFGLQIKAPTAILMPVDEGIYIDSRGYVNLMELKETHVSTPCIDQVCEDVLGNLQNVNLAIFSGMATDGVAGAGLVHKAGGQVITQTEASSLISSISEAVRVSGISAFDGTPEDMAKYVMEGLKNGEKHD